MKLRPPVVDYRKFRFSKLKTPEFSHLILLLYWPIYGLLFLFVERFYPVTSYTAVYCRADDLIPFCEWFLLPYMWWFVYLTGMILYTLFYDPRAFRRMMYFIMITYTITIIIYFVYPTCQELRPVEFARENVLTRLVGRFYQFDTNTNVCPSIHVIGSLATLAASWDMERFRSRGWRLYFLIAAVLISISTVFLKQHSLIDIVAALPLCVLAYGIVYRGWFGRRKNTGIS